MDVQRLGHEVTDLATRVQRGGRVLKVHLHAVAEGAKSRRDDFVMSTPSNRKVHGPEERAGRRLSQKSRPVSMRGSS
jgi:hypothetical protein